MTSKKESILKSALELFARDGFKGTPTIKIAKAAGVSEALIFKHFKNKEGLLHAVIENGVERSKMLIANIILEPNPKALLRKYILVPFEFPESEMDYWKLIFKIKWEIEYKHEGLAEPLKLALSNAFEKLGYKKPREEAEFLYQFMDGISGNLLKGSMPTGLNLKDFLIEKYNLNE